MKKSIFSIILLFSVLTIWAREHNSLIAGNWSNPGTWDSGRVPAANDVVNISHAVTLDTDVSDCEEITINGSGSLKGSGHNLRIKNNHSLIVKTGAELEVNDIQFDNGSTIDIEAGTDIKVQGNFTNNNHSDQVTINGTMTVEGGFYNGEGGVIVGSGTICIKGSYTGAGISFGYDPTDDIPDGSCIPVTAPVELLDFSVNIINNYAELIWHTASEENCDYFDIEKSSNGIDFEAINRIKGAGTSNVRQEYIYQDKSLPAGTVYYRLKQVDFNGNFEYLDIISASNDKSGTECKLNVNPNPCIGKCMIKFEDCYDSENADVKIAIYDAMGNAVYSSLSKKVSSGEAAFSIDANNNLVPGVYIIRGGNESKIIDKKIIIDN
ncbi:MAG: T9SS type A sorting domain-containing protein [Bacteroidia bacterium]|nr:T9SS type A sorting domain-containing protein [Bacteroidia bacterium]